MLHQQVANIVKKTIHSFKMYMEITIMLQVLYELHDQYVVHTFWKNVLGFQYSNIIYTYSVLST